MEHLKTTLLSSVSFTHFYLQFLASNRCFKAAEFEHFAVNFFSVLEACTNRIFLFYNALSKNWHSRKTPC